MTCYDVYIYAECASGDTSLALFGTFCTLPFCSDVTSLGATTQVDSLLNTWNWTESDPMYPATGFNTHCETLDLILQLKEQFSMVISCGIVIQLKMLLS